MACADPLLQQTIGRNPTRASRPLGEPATDQPTKISPQQSASNHPTRKSANKKATLSGGFSALAALDPHGSDSAVVDWSECFTWHRPIFSGGYPPNIVGAAAFHNRVRDGSEWFHRAMDTRIDQHTLACAVINIRSQVNPENCIDELEDKTSRLRAKKLVKPSVY